MQVKFFGKDSQVFWKIMFYSENLSLTVLYCLFEFLKRLEIGLTLFEECLQKLLKNW
jgi:hypothetical protein